MFDQTGQSPDKNLLLAILALIAFGWVMSFSASLGHFNSYSFAIKQAFYIGIGLFVGFFILKTPLSFYKKHSTKFFVAALVLLTLVFVPYIGAGKINGAYRWINVFGLFNFQPSEMMKLAMILFMAAFLVRQEKSVTSSIYGIVKTLLIVGASGALTMAETDLGATIIITISAFSMLFIAGSYVKELFLAIGGLLSGLSIYVYLDPTRLERWLSFWINDLWGKEGVLQTRQALIGIARGDWTGTGLGAGIQKYSRLPESHTDMIFAIIGEEVGIIGMFFVLFSFAYILGKGFNIAKEALKHGRKYSSYVAFGICSWFAMQTGVNIAMNLGLIPIKGFTLPLISYGGSSMIFSIIALAIILRIDMENRASYNKQRHYV